MGRRNFSRRGARRGTRSPTDWTGIVVPENALASSSKVLLGSFAPSAGSGHETVVRVVGRFAHHCPSPGVGGTLVVGLGVFSDASIAAGIGSLPDPVTDIADDLWTTIIPMPYAGATINHGRFDVDSRGMRKVEEGQQLAIIAANAVGVSIEFSGYLRILAKVAIRS